MSRVLALIAILAGCQPFYRDNLRAGRRAENSAAIDRQLEAAERAASSGDLPRAIELARDAIRANPERERGYIVLAINLRRAGQAGQARTIVNRAEKVFGSRIRKDLVSAYVADELIADAIDHSNATDLKTAAAELALAPILGELVKSESRDLEVAMKHYLDWLEAYGIPDHLFLRDARARIAKRIGESIDGKTPVGRQIVAIGPRAELAHKSGDISGALTLYGLAFRLLPDDKFLVYRGAMARAAGAVTDPAQMDPVAWGLAVDGDAALKAGKLGVAIHAYRRAVAQAPWWGAAHGNLAELLTLAGRDVEAGLESTWAAGLAPGAGWAQEAAGPQGETDLDGDRIVEPKDGCAYEPEDRDGFEDDDGCPELDNDRDVLPDAKDRCPNVAEDKDGFEDDDGCPDLDNDNDRIPDAADTCPVQPETFNGAQDNDGCPDAGRVIVDPTALRLLDPIAFRGSTAKLARSAHKILDAVVATLAGYPKLTVEIGGHSNVLGKPELDLALTRDRAASVSAYLVAHGIAETRLTVVGYGDTKPLSPTVDARRVRNDRIELSITRSP